MTTSALGRLLGSAFPETGFEVVCPPIIRSIA
jgi:hypothetical protein